MSESSFRSLLDTDRMKTCVLAFVALTAYGACCLARSPGETVERYYAMARAHDFDGAQRLLASYEQKKDREFSRNADNGLAWIHEHKLVPKVHGEKVRGRFAMVVVGFDELPNERWPKVRPELLVRENDQWRLLPTSRPYIDADNWEASPGQLADLRHLELWYVKKNREILGYENRPIPLRPGDEIFTRQKITDAEYVDKRLSAGLDPASQNDTLTNQDSLIHFAVRHNALDTVRVLLRHGTDVDTKSPGLAKTPLFFAAFNGNVEMIKLLVDRGADANAVDDLENNALREAIAGGHASAVEALLDAKADADHKNADGVTMRELAQKHGSDAIRALFERQVRSTSNGAAPGKDTVNQNQ